MSTILPGVEVRDVRSHVLKQDLQLYIKLPWYYDRSDAAYPVLYSLDANRAFPLYSTMSLIHETPGTETTEITIVGVGYKTDSDRIRGLAQWAAWRARDLTPVRSEETEKYWERTLAALLEGERLDVQTGDAPQFLRCLCEEIIPFVETSYRVSSGGRGLAGCSYGGLFTLYALFHASEMFTRYFAGTLTWWDPLFESEEHYAGAHDDLQAKPFVTAGGREADALAPMQRMVDRLRSRGYPGLDVRTHVFEGEEHSSACAASVSRALCVLYNEDGPDNYTR